MATYKVLQDIEGEDKLIAWLSPKQTIFAAIVVISLALAIVLGRINWLLAVPWIIPIVVFGFLAAPLGRDQPNDVWLAAQIRFYLKNRKRIWDQSGMQELVHITVPKKEVKYYTDGLNQGEVRSRLKALSATIDSRGWVIKNSAVNLSSSPQFAAQFQNEQANGDRLIGTESMTMDVPVSDVSESEDILDEQNNSVAQRFDTQIRQQQETHKQALLDSMRSGKMPAAAPQAPSQVAAEPPADLYFLKEEAPAPVPVKNQAAPPEPVEQLATFNTQVVAPGTAEQSQTVEAAVGDAEQALLDKIHHDQEVAQGLTNPHEKILKTPDQLAEEERIMEAKMAEEQRLAREAEQQRLEAERREHERQAQKTAPDAIIKELSQAGSDLKISTLASQAKHAIETNEDGEVVISLH